MDGRQSVSHTEPRENPRIPSPSAPDKSVSRTHAWIADRMVWVVGVEEELVVARPKGDPCLLDRSISLIRDAGNNLHAAGHGWRPKAEGRNNRAISSNIVTVQRAGGVGCDTVCDGSRLVLQVSAEAKVR